MSTTRYYVVQTGQVPATLSLVRKQTYVDSVTLLQVSAEVLAFSGVQDAALVMATDLNRDVLRDSNLLVGDAPSAGANDLVIPVRADDEDTAREAVERAEKLLLGGRAASISERYASLRAPRSIRAAHRAEPAAQLAVISVPGQYAAGEARQALADGLHVFLFSDNVSLEDEVDLKRRAQARGLLVMGPDCGTAILHGTGFGFANRVRRGSIGVVGASGTGIQEVTSLVHRAGLGISHAIGTGSRDVYARVGGLTTLAAIDLLATDPATQSIVLVSKPSDASVAREVVQRLAATGKPSVVYLQGTSVDAPDRVRLAGNLAEAAALATGGERARAGDDTPRVSLGDRQRQVRGLFCGGTLAQEAALILGDRVDHQLVDFGDDEYTRGRAHPMIDPRLRNQAIVQAGSDPRVAVVLLDFILGLGSHSNPVGAALPAIESATRAAHSDGRELAVLAHVVGTDADPQGLADQEDALRAAGVRVFGSNYAAAVAAERLVTSVIA